MILSQSSQYAICGLAKLAASDADFHRVTDLVRGTSAPAHAVAKVFQQLAKRGFVRSRRGARGGFRLSERCRRSTLLEVIEAVEGNWRSSIEESGFCSPTEPCPLSLLLRPVHRELYRVLSTTRIADLISSSKTAEPDHRRDDRDGDCCGAGAGREPGQPCCGEQS